MQYGMIGYFVPHSVYPPGYHCNPKQPLPFASLASQKNHLALYLMCLYSDPKQEEWFRKAWAKTGKRLDMGKSCIRFKRIDDLALKVIGDAIKRVPAKKFIKHYESILNSRGKLPKPLASAKQKGATKKHPTAKRPTAAKRSSRSAAKRG